MTASMTATATEDRALSLLGSGVGPEAVANALGVSPSRISQLLSNKEFADQVASLRYENLRIHNVRDSAYDTLEDKLLKKLEASIPLLFRPSDIAKTLQIINNAKRRGQSAPDQVTNQQNIVNLVLPTMIKNKFVTNTVNQVVKAGDQDLITMQSGNLLSLSETSGSKPTESQAQELTHEPVQKIPTPEGFDL